MIIRTGAMRVVGILLLLAVGIDALALNWNRPSASVCQGIENINATTGITPIVPADCEPINYTLALVLACVGVGLIVVASFVGNRDS